ncbi:ABC transporter permease [Lactobacillus sp. ESL0679]|uniref:ABC transporter permease n=1 Tax=Lactobacillus sp. ESL0679 TaxID=2983209 RepID=UPI0023F951B0|nr:ABC transporter permease [Lactobacillus sp. ESL0679]MDF7683431.1 ABC transporter permease [Lactobacillus sp. ESL0679]
MKFKKFITSRGPLLATLVTLLYGILVFAIYFFGYHAMPTNVDKLPITIVNQDTHSKTIARQLKKSLPFDTINETKNLSQAKTDLDQRTTYLIIDIPRDFAKKASQNRSAQLHFYINDSNQSTVTAAMKSTAQSVAASLNKKISTQKAVMQIAAPKLKTLKRNLLKQEQQAQLEIAQAKQQIATSPAAMQPKLTTRLKQKVASQKLATRKKAQQQEKQIIAQAKAQAKPTKEAVSEQLHRQHALPTGINYAMAPFFAILALYLGTMMASLTLYGTYAKFAKEIGRFKSFINLEITYILVAAFSTLITSFITMKFVNVPTANFMNLWLVHFLLVCASFNFTGIFYFLLGQIGAVINVIITMLQIVAGAGMMPVVTMNPFFKAIHYIIPLYYGILGDYTNFYGGPSITTAILGLAAIYIITLLISLIIVTIMKKQPMLKFEEIS